MNEGLHIPYPLTEFEKSQGSCIAGNAIQVVNACSTERKADRVRAPPITQGALLYA